MNLIDTLIKKHRRLFNEFEHTSGLLDYIYGNFDRSELP